MPNDMTAAECAEVLDNLQQFLKLGDDLQCSQVILNPTYDKYQKQINALDYAASILRKYAAGELVDVVRCKDCIRLNKQLCRASKCTKYDLKTDKRTYKTLMEPDGFCSISEKRMVNRNESNNFMAAVGFTSRLRGKTI